MEAIKVVKCRGNHVCQKCVVIILSGNQAYRVNTRRTGIVYRCMNCKITKADIEDIAEDRYNERYDDLNKRISTEEF